MTMRRVTTTLILTVGVLSLALAEAPAPSHVKAAVELLEATHVELAVNNGVDIMLKAQLQANPQLAPFEDIFRSFLTKYVSWEALREDYTRLYVDTFSESEIHQLLTFYHTPLGQKVISAMPDLMQKGAALGQSKVAAHLDELKELVAKRAQEMENKKQAP